MPWVITYDITSPKRWKKIYDKLNHVAFHIQLSVFYTEFNEAEIKTLYNDLLKIINKKKDDLRIYKIENIDKVVKGGKSTLPSGIKIPNKKILNHSLFKGWI